MKKQIKIWSVVFLLCLTALAPKAFALKGKLTIAPTCWGNGVLDPHQVTTGCEIIVTGLVMYNGLLQRDLAGRIQPYLATHWSVSDDGLTYTFFLRKGVYFHNGDPFTAEDVKFSYDRVLSDEVKSIRKPIIKSFLNKVEIVDPYQVKLHLKSPYPAIVERLGDYMLIMPKKYYEKVGKKGFEKAPIGTGPWKFVKRDGNDTIYYTANETYFSEGPFIKDLVLRNIPEEATKWAALKNGEIDAASFTAIPYLNEGKASSKFKIYTVPNAATLSLWPRFDKPVDKLDAKTKPLLDVRVRRAIVMAIDRQSLVDATLNGYGSVMKYNICPNERGFRESDKPIPYDPAGAKRLLAAAGYPNGFKTVINAFNSDVIRLQMQFVQAQLAEVGIQAELNFMDLGTFYKRVFGKKDLSGLSVAGWYTGTHFEPWGWKGLASPYQGPAWEDLQQLYKKVSAAYRIPDRQRYADEIRNILIEKLPVLPLAIVDWPWIVNADIISWPFPTAYNMTGSAYMARKK